MTRDPFGMFLALMAMVLSVLSLSLSCIEKRQPRCPDGYQYVVTTNMCHWGQP